MLSELTSAFINYDAILSIAIKRHIDQQIMIIGQCIVVRTYVLYKN